MNSKANMIVKLDPFLTIITLKSQAKNFPSILRVVMATIFLYLVSTDHADAQTSFMRSYCNVNDDATNLPAFYGNLNSSFADIRATLRSSTSTLFATAELARSSEPVFALFQCRPYLSYSDCLACFDEASNLARRTCTITRGAITISDGCFLRYENSNHFGDVSNLGQTGFCDDSDRSPETVLNETLYKTVENAFMEVVDIVPREDKLFALGRKAVDGGAIAVFVAGQCVKTIERAQCRSCLESAVSYVVGCMPAGGGRAVQYGCFLRFSTSPFFNQSQALDLNRVARSGPASSSKTRAVIGGSIGAAAFILIIVVAVLCLVRSRRHKETEWTWMGNMDGLTEAPRPVSFTYNELKSATGDFDTKNKLGRGGFSTVYKGVLRDGKTIAIKKLEISQTMEARSSFETEVMLIGNTFHRNLVRLLGCCRKGPDLLLVYEYMEKSSLDRYIFGGKSGTLDWKQRFDIIVGTARGLAYLHEEFHVCIIHRDIKPGNILLDDNLQPKIADFGLARLFPENKSHVKTRLAGTMGYAAPEYVLSGHLSEKVDTYSFGIVILEMLSGRRINDLTTDTDSTSPHLLARAWRLYENGSLLDLVETTLDAKEEMKKVIEIGLMCTQSAPLRPTMSEVVTLLMSEDYPSFDLTNPTNMRGPSNSKRSAENPSLGGSSSSNASLTLSIISAR